MADDQNGTVPTTNNEAPKDELTSASRSKFRFKSKTKSNRIGLRGHPAPTDEDLPDSHHDGERHHRHHHHSKRRRLSCTPEKNNNDNPSLYDDTHLPNTSSSRYLNSDIAFRESLFDAMADDEGAQFWEGVYGQPIHTYPDVKEGPTGELERMTDEEYTAFVRAKMYEKTHQHLIEEKARREAARKAREKVAKEGAKEEREAEKFRRKVEESLKRGQERKERKTWGERWEAYLVKWDKLGKDATAKIALASIPWPVESGRRKDVTVQEVERFFLFAPTSGQPSEMQLGKVLKSERVRWHPDKIQQKLGGQGVSEDVIQAVTEVFQVIDRLWSQSKN